jgi:hypothetical protein
MPKRGHKPTVNWASPTPKPKEQRVNRMHCDAYSDREGPGLERAQELVASMVPSLGGRMPTPPPRRW